MSSSQIQENRVTNRGIGSRQLESMSDTQCTCYPTGLQLGEAGPTSPAGTTGRAFTMQQGVSCKNGGGRAVKNSSGNEWQSLYLLQWVSGRIAVMYVGQGLSLTWYAHLMIPVVTEKYPYIQHLLDRGWVLPQHQLGYRSLLHLDPAGVDQRKEGSPGCRV